jgi:hypothetical protein
MQDPMEPDRQEILSGPGDVRLASRSANTRANGPKSNKKTLIIAASALVAVLAAGGAGYLLAGNPTGTTPQGGGRPATSQSAGADEQLQRNDPTTGDAAPDKGGLSTDAPDDGSMGDAVTDPGDGSGEPADTGSTGTDSSPGTPQTNNGKKPATTSPTKPAQSSTGDVPANGPAGEVIGQCAKSGC